jgi:hypothetical protein
VPSTILDNDIALLEMNRFPLIQFEPYLAFENDSVIHCICLVHGSVFFFKVVRKPLSRLRASLCAALPSKDGSLKTEPGGKVTI